MSIALIIVQGGNFEDSRSPRLIYKTSLIDMRSRFMISLKSLHNRMAEEGIRNYRI